MYLKYNSRSEVCLTVSMQPRFCTYSTKVSLQFILLLQATSILLNLQCQGKLGVCCRQPLFYIKQGSYILYLQCQGKPGVCPTVPASRPLLLCIHSNYCSRCVWKMTNKSKYMQKLSAIFDIINHHSHSKVKHSTFPHIYERLLKLRPNLWPQALQLPHIWFSNTWIFKKLAKSTIFFRTLYSRSGKQEYLTKFQKVHRESLR